MCSPCYCHPLLLSLLGTFNEQLGPRRCTAIPTLSSLDTGKTAGRPISVHPVLGRTDAGVLGGQPCSLATLLRAMAGLRGWQGTGMVPGAGPCPGQRFGKRVTYLAGRATPLPHPQPGCARGGGQRGHVVAGRLALPGAGAAALPSCSGCVPRLAGAGAGERRPWQGFSSGLGSLVVPGWPCPSRGPGLGIL